MQKRTRIFAAITVAVGLLLGLGMFVATLVPASAAPTGHRHPVVKKKTTIVVKKGKTITVTSTVNNTITVTPPPPPGPFCFPSSSTLRLSSGNNSQTGTTINPGEVQFELECQNLNPSNFQELEVRFPCRFVNVKWNSTDLILSQDGQGPGAQGGVGGGAARTLPDLNGKIQFTIILQECEPGQGVENLKDFTTLQSASASETLVGPF